MDVVASRPAADGYRVELTADGVVERPLGGEAARPPVSRPEGYSEPPSSSDTLS